MTLIKPLLTPLFNQEILRVAKQRHKATEDGIKELLLEIASDCGVGLRAVYHWRSGRHPIPSDFLPMICKCLGSNALQDEMNRLRAQIEVEVPEQFDLVRLITESLQEDMTFMQQIISDFESDGIQPTELDRLDQLGARVHGNTHRLLEIARADCHRRLGVTRKASVPAAKPNSKLQISDSRKTGTR